MANDELEKYDNDFVTLLSFLSGALISAVILYIIYYFINPTEKDFDQIKSGALSEEIRLHRKSEYAKIVLITSYICVYYSLSISFTVFNKWFLNIWEGY
jgi:hypothetical protein